MQEAPPPILKEFIPVCFQALQPAACTYYVLVLAPSSGRIIEQHNVVRPHYSFPPMAIQYAKKWLGIVTQDVKIVLNVLQFW